MNHEMIINARIKNEAIQDYINQIVNNAIAKKTGVVLPEAIEKTWDEANIAGREVLAIRAGIVPDVDFGYEKIEGDFFSDLPSNVQNQLRAVSKAEAGIA